VKTLHRDREVAFVFKGRVVVFAGKTTILSVLTQGFWSLASNVKFLFFI